jgi:hypothetical protein
MHDFRSLIRAIVFILVVSAVHTLQAQDGLSAAFARLDSVRDFSGSMIGPAIATADFNNDTYPDGAVLYGKNHSFQIEVHFRFHRVSKLSFDSKFSTLSISAFDVNNDGSPDLVVEEPFSRHRLFVWLNDGSGSFRSAHAENYPAGSDDGYRTFAGPSERPQSPAMGSSGKSRVRLDSSGSLWTAAPRGRLRFNLRETTPLPEFSSTPNLVRGPPTLSLSRS